MKQYEQMVELLSNGTQGHLMKFYQQDKQIWDTGAVNRTYQFGIVKNKSLFWVCFENPGSVYHYAGGINILFSLFGSSLLSVEFQQQKFSLAFGFFTDYFGGWDND